MLPMVVNGPQRGGAAQKTRRKGNAVLVVLELLRTDGEGACWVTDDEGDVVLPDGECAMDDEEAAAGEAGVRSRRDCSDAVGRRGGAGGRTRSRCGYPARCQDRSGENPREKVAASTSASSSASAWASGRISVGWHLCEQRVAGR